MVGNIIGYWLAKSDLYPLLNTVSGSISKKIPLTVGAVSGIPSVPFRTKEVIMIFHMPMTVGVAIAILIFPFSLLSLAIKNNKMIGVMIAFLAFSATLI